MPLDPEIQAAMEAARARRSGKTTAEHLATNGATLEQVNQAWPMHIMQTMAGQAGIDPTAPGPVSVEQVLGAAAEEEKQLSKIAGGDSTQLASLKQKLAARDAITVGGLFFGGPTIGTGVGAAGAVAGAVGRLAAGASIGAGLGLSEGLLGGYELKDVAQLGQDYTVGTLALGIPLEAAGGVLRAGTHLAFQRELGKLAKELDSTIRTAGELNGAIAKDPAAGEMLGRIADNEALIKAGREELISIRREVARRGRNVRSSDIKRSPGLRDFLFNQLKDKYPGLSPEAAPEVLWNYAKKEGILPSLAKRTKSAHVPTPTEQAARDAYHAALGAPDIEGKFYSPGRRQAALQTARRAAYQAKNQELAEALHVGALEHAKADAATSTTPPDVIGFHRWLGYQAIKRAATIVRRPQFFGEVGPAFGAKLHNYIVLREATEGHWTRIVQDNILHGLNKAELENLDEYIRWSKPALNSKVVQAAERWIQLRKVIADEAKGLNLPAKDRGLTEMFRGLSREDRAAVLKVQRGLPEGATPPKMSLEAQQLVTALQRLEGKVERDGPDWHVIRPFEESAIKAPDYYKPEVLAEMERNPNHPVLLAIEQQVLRERPELVNPATGQPFSHAVASEVRARLGIGGTSAPDYIWNNSLQWSREALIDPKYRISDPRDWMLRYVHGAANRLSAAHTFGAREEHFTAMWDELARQTGTRLQGPEFKAAGYGTRVEGKYQAGENLRLMKDMYDIAMGRGKPSPLAVRQIRDITLRHRIGFTTYIKQFSSLKNVAAAHGVANTLEGMWTVLTNPRARQLGDDVGATLADLVHVLSDETVAINPKNKTLRSAVKTFWGESAQDQLRRTGTLIGDRFTRRVSAVAAGLKAEAAAREVRNLGSTSWARRHEAEQARRWLEHMDLDVNAILSSGLTQGQRRQAMLSGARGTQFTSTVEDIPLFISRTETGKMIGLLQKFSYQQGPFLIKHLLREGLMGNLKPIIAFGVFMGLGDHAMGELLKAMSNQNYDIASGMMVDAIFGKFGSVAAEARKDPRLTFLNLVTGPAYSLGADILGAGSQATQAAAAGVTGDLGGAAEHGGKALWHLTPSTLRQLMYLLQTTTGQR